MKKKPIAVKQLALGSFFWLLIISALLLTVILPPLVLTQMGFSAFRAGDFLTAAQRWHTANLIVDPLAQLTKPFGTDGLIWSTSLSIGENLANDLSPLRQGRWQSVYDLPTDQLVSHLPNYLLQLDSIQANIQSAHFLNKPMQTYQLVNTISEIKSWLTAFTPVLNGSSKWIVLLQNDNELRATGGFMGSYALLTINQGKIVDLTIEDIYDADGQFTGYFPPPAGIKEYLSSGNGLRLPDANWNPDFPSSAQQVLGYFALGKRHDIVGVVAITNSVISEILKITGPIPLPDYQTSLTADTIDSVLQNRPQPFFPGSIQKKHMLTQAKNQLFVALSTLSTESWKQLFSVIQQQITKKNILFFSLNEPINSLLDAHNVSGKLATQNNNQEILEIVESNVGINKSNQWQHRTVTVDFTQPFQCVVSITFSNQASELLTTAEARYTNYLRLMTNQSWQLKTVTVENESSTHTWDEGSITTIAGDTFTQVGGLVVVEPRTVKTVKFTYQRDSTQPHTLMIVKQPGLPDTHYTILEPGGDSQQFVLQSNYEVSY